MMKHPPPFTRICGFRVFFRSLYLIRYSYEYMLIFEKTSCPVTKAIQTFRHSPRTNRASSLFVPGRRVARISEMDIQIHTNNCILNICKNNFFMKIVWRGAGVTYLHLFYWLNLIHKNACTLNTVYTTTLLNMIIYNL